MTPDQLRALADALSRQRQADEHGIYCAVPRQAVDAAIRHLRAQADAQPVAWMHTDGRVVPAATMDQSYRDGGGMRSSLRDYTIPLYTHPAPAVPQAEPIADSDADYWLRNRQAILDAIERAGFVLMSNASGFWLHPRGTTDAQAEPKRDQSMLDLLAVIHCDGGHHTEAVGIEQSIKDALTAVCMLKGKLAEAEPKREPLSDEQIAEEATNRQMTAACEDAFYDGVRWAESAHGIGGSDAE